MRTLLSKKESAQLIILEVLLEKQKISLDDLAKVSLISKQTLCSYLDELLTKLPFLQIKKKNNEIRLLKNTIISYPVIYSYFYTCSDHFAFLEYLFFHPFTQTNKLIDQLHLNPSKYRRIKKQTICFLEKENIFLSNSPLYFHGDFYHLAHFFTTFLYEKYPSLTSLIPARERKVIKEITDGLSKQIPEELHIELYIWVMIKLSMHYPRCLTDSSNQEMDCSKILVNQKRFEQTFKIPYTVFIHNLFVRCYTDLNQPILPTEKREFKKELLHLRKKMYQIFQAQSDSFLPHTVDLIIHFLDGRTYLLNSFKKSFVLDFFMQNGCFCSSISEQLKQAFLIFRNKIANDDLFFELIYYLIVHDTTLVQLFIQHQQAKRIAVACTFGNPHNLMLAAYLNQWFGSRFSFEAITFDNMVNLERQVETYDFFLTNLAIVDHPKCISCDSFLNNHDLNYLVHLFSHSMFQDWLKEFR